MRLFWKVFLLLLVTLAVTAATSSWLSQKWMHENQAIETRLQTLAGLGETAVSLYQDEGIGSYRQWLHHTVRNHRFRGTLINSDGEQLLHRQVPPPLQSLLDEVQKKRQPVTVIDPPRLLAALPINRNGETFYWLVHTRMSPQEMKQGGTQMLIIRLLSVLLAIAAVSWLLTRMFTRPIRALQQTTEQLGAGNLSSRTDASVASRRDELGELACSFDEMAEQLESLIGSHKQLLRDISHELRSPLARLQVALELARNSAGACASEELDRIGREAELLNELIGEVLTLARIEQGAVEIQYQPLQLDEIVDEVVADAAFEAEAENRAISIKETLPVRISGDRLWITRALDNVIRNAIKHSPAGSSVEVALVKLDQQIKIEVRDFGEGVDESMLERLFEPFVRASEARERHVSSSGYGLGLAIAKHAIELHGGDIMAANHENGGLIVTIILPWLEE